MTGHRRRFRGVRGAAPWLQVLFGLAAATVIPETIIRLVFSSAL